MTRGMHLQTGVFEGGDGARLPYACAGRGTPVVLVHGFGLDHALWDPQWPALARGYRVLRYDLRGHGAAPPPAVPYSHAADLAALLDSLDARPAHVVGLSMGGRIALRLALEVPAAVRSLTLVDSVLEGHPMSEDWSQRWRAVIATARAGDVAAARRAWLAHPLFAPTRSSAEAGKAFDAMIERYSGWHWLHRDPELASTRPALEALASVSVPALVVVGEHDLPEFQAIARRLVADLPQATLAVIAGAGHLPNLEAPEAFNDVLLAHLAAC